MPHAAGDIKMQKCAICMKAFNTEKCLKKHVTIMYGKDKKHCPWLVYLAKYKGQKQFSKKYLEKMYWEENKTTVEMAQELGVGKPTLLRTIKFYQIKMRDRSEATKNQIQRQGLWNRGKNKYNHPSIARYAQSRMGKNNPFYTAPNYEERYNNLLKVSKRGLYKFLGNRNPKTTEDRMDKILSKNNINFNRNFSIQFKNTWRLFDFLIEGKLLIELQGNYYHANPKYYNADDVFIRGSKKITAKQIWNNDKEKFDLANNSTYAFIFFWEDDFSAMTDDEILAVVRQNL